MTAGDALARGAKSAVFPPAGGNVSQKKWDDIWADDGGNNIEPLEEVDEYPYERFPTEEIECLHD